MGKAFGNAKGFHGFIRHKVATSILLLLPHYQNTINSPKNLFKPLFFGIIVLFCQSHDDLNLQRINTYQGFRIYTCSRLFEIGRALEVNKEFSPTGNLALHKKLGNSIGLNINNLR